MTSTTKPRMLITGGSRGIGAACARLAGSRGYRVCINYRERADAAEALCQAIQADGGEAIAVQADISRPADITALFSRCDSQWGGLDVLVNNAGVVAPSIRFEDIDAARIDSLLQLNVTGAMIAAREAVRRMSTRLGGSGGSIINISSVAALFGSPREYIDYASSKGALDTFTIGLANELARDGVRVNGVRPGIIDTDIHGSVGQPDRVERVAPSIPMGRAGQADEVAYAILWLASEEASYVTGSFLNVAGGRC